MWTLKRLLAVGLVGAAGLPLAAITPASATPCTSSNLTTTVCTLDSQTFDPIAADSLTTGANANGLTFIVNFTTSDQSPSNVSPLVLDYLSLLGVTGATYLGRAGDSATYPSSVSSIATTGTANGSDGSWSLTLQPASVGTEIGSYVAIHAGGGQSDNLFLINSPGLSGTFQTNNGHDLSNFDLFGCPATGTGTCNGERDGNIHPTPEPASMALLATGLIGLAGILRARKRVTSTRN